MGETNDFHEILTSFAEEIKPKPLKWVWLQTALCDQVRNVLDLLLRLKMSRTKTRITPLPILLLKEGLHHYSQHSSTKQKPFCISPAQNTVMQYLKMHQRTGGEWGKREFLRPHKLNNDPNCRFVNDLNDPWCLQSSGSKAGNKRCW